MQGQTIQPLSHPPDGAEIALAKQLRADIGMLAGTIGERNVSRKPRQLEQAAAFIEAALAGAGYKAEAQPYNVGGTTCRNLAAEIRGTSHVAEILVVGAHYDTVPGGPGADDNSSGVATVLALARHFAHSRPLRTLRFVAFVNEEPPYFQTADMGSLVYAKECRRRGERIQAMLSVESVGYYSATQEYPAAVRGLFPPRGDFIAFVGNLSSASLVREAAKAFRQAVDLPAEAAALPEEIEGVGWSDHWSFWRQGYPAIEVTDTAPYRNPHYHMPSDKPETLDYNRLARLTTGMYDVVAALANPALK
jgi:Zn-dependent M28 family amino/carboxypeptidase